jgi:CRISPR system Cascade subunit CasB
MTPRPRDDREQAFSEYLSGLAKNENRGALAALRRGLSDSGASGAAINRYVAGWLRDRDRRWDEDCFYLVAGLFGRYPSTKPAKHNFGGSYRELCAAKGTESLERRFVALLAADAESVGMHLRHAVALLASKEIAVDWAQLLHDLRRWGQPKRRVQRRWAREFWNQGQNGNTAPEE